MNVVVLGGYGLFGSRICRGLARDPHIALMVAGRDAQRASRFAQELGGEATGVKLDINATDFTAHLRALAPGLVIHTAGPFQEQGYGVAQATAECGAHYIDLADGRRFVCDFGGRFDEQYRSIGRTAVSGASTLPALSSAVIDTVGREFAVLNDIDLCVAPAQRTPRGEATMAAVLSYCGEAITVWRDGRWEQQVGWAAPVKAHFAHMAPRLSALCDVPDLELLPGRYPDVQNVMFRAALEISMTQRALALIAAAKRVGLLKHPARLAPWLHRTAGWFDRFGSTLGGMSVRLKGKGFQGEPVTREWHLSADVHGPEIPCMPSILLARKLARGETLSAGAGPCTGMLCLNDFNAEFLRWGMRTTVWDHAA